MDDHLGNQGIERLEERVNRLGATFPYPPTPDISSRVLGRVRRPHSSLRLPGRVLVLAVVLLAIFILSIPPVRAAMREFLQLGNIRIFLQMDNPTVVIEPESYTVPPTRIPSGVTSSPDLDLETALSPPAFAISELEGERTLAGAQAEFPYPSPLPTYPPDLGAPDRAYLQDLGGPAVLFVWLDDPEGVVIKMSLMILGPGASAGKGPPESITEITVNGARALWLEGEHLMILETASGIQPVYLIVEGNVLIWEWQGLTFRLEGRDSMDVMIRIAESLK